MTQMNRTDALEILSSGEFEVFLGVEESAQLDFKGAPYQLDKMDSEKYELAKDVAAFANADGGLVVVGIATTPSKTSAVDEASEVRLLDRDLVNTKQYLDVLYQRVHPKPVDLDVRFHPSRTDPTRGLICIDVPAQPEAKRPFLVRRPMQDDAKTPGWLIGYPTRRKDDTDHVTIEELHQRLKDGSRDPTIAELLESVGRIEELIAGPGRDRVPPAIPLDARSLGLIERVADDDIAKEAIPPGHSHLYMSAVVDQGRVRDFLGARGAREFLEHPPFTRADGWNLVTLDRAQVLSGTHIRVGSADRKRIDLFQDGGMVALAIMPGFLARGSTHEPWTINALALIEFVYDFLAAYSVLIREWIEPTPSAMAVALEIRQAQWEVSGAKYVLRLSPYDVSDHRSGIPLPGGAPSPSLPVANEVEVNAENDPAFPAGALAHQLVQAIYEWWGTDIPVPYSTDAVIDPDTFPS